ncbi:MAG: hypothetical protein AB7L09_02400 [Nitrospira sp.]
MRETFNWQRGDLADLHGEVVEFFCYGGPDYNPTDKCYVWRPGGSCVKTYTSSLRELEVLTHLSLIRHGPFVWWRKWMRRIAFILFTIVLLPISAVFLFVAEIRSRL